MRLIHLFITAGLLAAANSQAGTMQSAFDRQDWHTIQEQCVDLTIPRCAYFLGRIAYERNQFEEAEDYFEDAIKQINPDADDFYWLGRIKAELINEVSFFNKAFYASAIRNNFTAALDKNPHHMGALVGLQKYYTHAPAIAGGSKEEALAFAARIQALDTDQGFVAELEIYRKFEDEQRAWDAIDKRRSASAIDPDVWFQIGVTYSRFGKSQEAHEAFEKGSDTSVKKNIWHYQNMYQLGRLSALHRQNLDKGERALRKFITEAPESSELAAPYWAKLRLSQILLHQQKNEVARKLLEDTEDVKTNDEQFSALHKETWAKL